MNQPLENKNEILIVDSDETVIYASRGLSAIFNCTRIKAKKPVKNFFPDFPDFRSLNCSDDQNYQCERAYDFNIDGKECRAYVFSKFLQQRKETLFYKNALEVLLDSIDEGVIITDQTCKLMNYNRVQQEFDNVTLDEVIGRNTWDIQDKEIPEETVLIRVINDKKPVLHYQQNYVIKNRYRKLDGCAYPIIIDDEVKGAIGVYRNLSQNPEMACKVIYAHQKKDKKETAKLGNLYTFENIICHDSNFKKSLQMAKSAAESTSTILIFGETGTGKELVAQSIHSQSHRRNKPFVAINCSALPENLIESILFGSKKGAFTGAENKKGLIETANGGTLFLDEINAMPIQLQNKLLRVLEEKTVRRIGGYKENPVDLRIISCINKPPQEAMELNELKADLFYRLAVVLIPIPPLRNRKTDIIPLVESFIEQLNKDFNKKIERIAPETLDIINSVSWPGNVRQLKHYVECIYNLIPQDKKILSHSYLPNYFNVISDRTKPIKDLKSLTATVQEKKRPKNIFKEIQEKEKERIVGMLYETNGNVSKAAKKLGITRKALQYRLNKYDLV
jgi:arginine utilization regulatory protein